MPETSTKRNRGGKAKSKGTLSPKSSVGNSKTPTKKGARGAASAGPGSKTPAKKQSPRGKGTISEAETRSLIPQKSLRSANPRDMMEIIAAAPKITGAYQEPYPRKRENDWAFTIEIEKARKFDAINLQKYYNGGQHVVAIIVPINDVSEWPMWKAFDTGEILQSYRGSDFERAFEVTTNFLADVLEMTPRNLQLLQKKKQAIKFGRDRWDLVGTFKAYMKAIKDEFQGRGGKEYSSQRTRKLTASADREEVKLAQENGELGYLEDFESEQMELALNYREAMERIPEAIAERLVKKPVHAIKRELAEEIKSVLEQLGIQASSTNGSNTGQAKTGRKKKSPKSGGRKKRSA